MEKSIESIWKEGFLKSDALIAPKLNNLYNQKSLHIVDKFRRMFKTNLRAIVIGSFFVLIVSFFVRMPVMGVLMFFLLNGIVIVNSKLLKGLEKIDKNVSSYQYLKSFEGWMKEQLSVNRRMAAYYYPYIFLAIVLGFWFMNIGEDKPRLGEVLVNELLAIYPETYLVFGIPLIGILGLILVISITAFFGGRIYNGDVNLIYGGVIKKLEELISDMEELRS